MDTGVARIDIAARARGDWVLLKLRDHGQGVAPENLANLTKPFFRGDAARTAANGAGLGLSTDFDMFETTVSVPDGVRSFDLTFISGGAASATGACSSTMRPMQPGL